MMKIGLSYWGLAPDYDCSWFATAIVQMTTIFASFWLERQIEMSDANTTVFPMRDNYDFSDSIPNPYAKRLKKQITIRLDEATIDYFKEMSLEKDIPYQSLINLYLRDCVAKKRELSVDWG